MKRKKNNVDTAAAPQFFNRELSWIEFNRRVLSEAQDPANPLLERLKFIAIVASNFDEFFLVRVAALKRQVAGGNYIGCPSGMSPQQQLEAVHRAVRETVATQYRCLTDEILPALAENGIHLRTLDNYTPEQAAFLKNMFQNEIFPVLTPVRAEVGHPLMGTGNLRLHAAFVLAADDDQTHLAIVQIPSSIHRIIWIPDQKGSVSFALIEHLIVQHAQSLFPGYRVVEHALFRVTRDADFGVDENRDEDFVEAMEQVISNRERSAPVRLSISTTSDLLPAMIASALGLEDDEVYLVDEPLDLKIFMDITQIPGMDHLRDVPWMPARAAEIADDEPVWDSVRRNDIVLFHPYESFVPIVRLIQEAADDPACLAIKMTLYRTSGTSPIVLALERAAHNGIHVTALVELKARFDEEQNIEWAERLEQAGVIVVYGIAQLKVHAKALMIVRREETGIRRYVHLGTGNYNDKTAKLYTDVGLLTCRDDITYEVGMFFNAITGYSTIPALTKLAMAPNALKNRLLRLIERETQKSSAESPGRIIAKINSLADVEIIEALYRASGAGVRITLICRGICMLVPGVLQRSENITVISIVDRFLEHARVLYFANGGDDEVYCSSADWMVRNLEKRVELLFPVLDERAKRYVIRYLEIGLRDNQKAHRLLPDGTYERVVPRADREPMRSQQILYEWFRDSTASEEVRNRREFSVRRKK